MVSAVSSKTSSRCTIRIDIAGEVVSRRDLKPWTSGEINIYLEGSEATFHDFVEQLGDRTKPLDPDSNAGDVARWLRTNLADHEICVYLSNPLKFFRSNSEWNFAHSEETITWIAKISLKDYLLEKQKDAEWLKFWKPTPPPLWQDEKCRSFPQCLSGLHKGLSNFTEEHRKELHSSCHTKLSELSFDVYASIRRGKILYELWNELPAQYQSTLKSVLKNSFVDTDPDIVAALKNCGYLREDVNSHLRTFAPLFDVYVNPPPRKMLKWFVLLMVHFQRAFESPLRVFNRLPLTQKLGLYVFIPLSIAWIIFTLWKNPLKDLFEPILTSLKEILLIIWILSDTRSEMNRDQK